MTIKGQRVKEILSGNEAIARGFYEAGGRFAASYPGTPSTEVLENLLRYDGVHAEWSVNEKVAFEAAFGASLAGVRAMAIMKHVGVNVAADPLLTASYTGVNAGLVLMAADDSGMFSSQNEQDTRQYARMAKIPCLEPSDSQEALEFVKAAFELSEGFDTPVLIRTTTRISHSKSVVKTSSPARPKGRGVHRDFAKYVMLPSTARRRHELAEERLERLAEYAETARLNRVHEGSATLGIIANGISYQYAREAFPGASFLKLGIAYPLPQTLIREFARKVRKLAVVEELDPFIEEQVRAMGIKVHYGKGSLSPCGEYSRDSIYQALSGKNPPLRKPVDGLIGRPPTFCPGCSHRGLFAVLSNLRVFVCGDIGCYTLGALPPFSALHSTICMGASIPGAHGMSKALRQQGISQKPVAVIGDSTFLHSGITGLMNMVYNGGDAVVIIMNNDTTGMTGGQEHPGTGRTASGAKAPKLDITALCRALGAKRVREIDTNNLSGLEKILKKELVSEGLSVLVSNQPCVLKYKVAARPLEVDTSLCDACKRCLKAGCVALMLAGGRCKRKVEIDPLLCTGCGVCRQLCGAGAIKGGT